MDFSKLVDALIYTMENYHIILIGLHYIVLFLAGFCLFTPGRQPEATLKKLAAWLEKYSKK